jgi:hypothetical protein
MEITLESYDATESITRARRAIDSFEKTGNVYFLLYGALDTRLCIERTLFEYLILIKTQEGNRRNIWMMLKVVPENLLQS